MSSSRRHGGKRLSSHCNIAAQLKHGWLKRTATVEKKLGKRKLLAAVYKISEEAEEQRLC